MQFFTHIPLGIAVSGVAKQICRFCVRVGRCGIGAWLLILLLPSSVFGWAATGHHVIAVAAFDLLSAADQAELMRILAEHPDFDRRFKPPQGMTGDTSIDRWRIGIAGCWPDLVRRSALDRPTWHYQLAATAVMGDATRVNIPTPPGKVPLDATLEMRDLYIGQAFELCRHVLADKNRPAADRAIALCWLCHLVADGHQPCHAGSLYAENAFVEGDRGGNSIGIGKSNLHSIWDNLLGSKATANNIRLRVFELQSDTATVNRVVAHRESFGYDGVEKWIDASLWLGESQHAGRRYVYSAEVVNAVTAVMRGLTKDANVTRLAEEYLTTAGRVARVRATQAGYRLAAIWTIALHP